MRHTGVVPFLLTLLSAVLYTLSFPPLSLSPLAWIALVPFFLAVAMVRPRQAAVYGILVGVATAFGVAWWLPGMLAHYFRFSAVYAWVGFFAVAIGLAGLYVGTFAAWLSWLARRGAATPLLVAAGWGVYEYARANLLIGNPWVLSGYSQVPFTPLMQIADATGPYGVGMLIAAVNACVAGFFLPALRSRRPIVSWAGVSIAFLAVLAYGQWRLSQSFANGEPIQVAIIQGAIPQQFRRDPAYRQTNLDHYLTLTKEAAAAHPTLVFWPENAVNFTLQQESPEREVMLQTARDLGIDLIVGGPYHRYGESRIHARNSVFLIRRGKVAGRYDKLRLLPFAEDDWVGRISSEDHSVYEAGDRLHTLRATNAQLGVFVCFEAMYSNLVRQFALQGAEVLVNPSNDYWFGHPMAARHQLDIASVRAIENRRYLVRPTATGFSAVIDPYGRSLALSGFGTAEVLTATIHPSRAQTPYLRWGDVVCWVAITIVIAASLYQTDWLRQKLQTRRKGNEALVSA